MDWIRFEGVERFYGARPILTNASGALRDAEKIGLVGVNGSGKSTLLRILAGIDVSDAGTVSRARGARIGYVGQEAPADADVSLRDVMESAFEMVRAEEQAIRELENDIARAANENDAAAEAALLNKYAAAREEHERHGGSGFERKMRSMLAAFGFSETDVDKPMSAMSGGQRTRASIARALLEDPDYLLLDEPTNHLDVEATRFLETLIARDPRAMIIVSHDRYVLDSVATTIWELDAGRIESYVSPRGVPAYTSYVDERRRRDEEAQRRYELFLVEKKRRSDVIAELRTHGSHNYAQVRSREKMLAKFDPPPDGPKTRQKAIAVRLASSRERSRGFALGAIGLAKAYTKPLFSGLEFHVARGERIAVVGPNGSGKSTLLKILAGLVPADAGTIEFASGVRPAYFSQESSAELAAGARAVDVVMEAQGLNPQQARALLGRMGLGGEHADKTVESFSGGERRRIMLARLMSRESDCLLLDEPTNDLDIASREALESALDDFGGTMLIVSHDRYLLRRLADRVLSLRDGQWTMLDAGYEAYEQLQRAGPSSRTEVDRVRRETADDADADMSLVVLSKNKRAELEREMVLREAEIDRLDARRADLEREYADPELYTDPQRVKLVHAELESVRKTIERATHAWEHIVETLHSAAP